MTHELDLILTLVGGLSAALLLGLVTQKLRLSPIVGYLFAGVAIGPFTPGFTAHVGLANQLAEIGLVLLMFGVGSSFRVNELLAVKRVALPGAFAGIAAGTALGFAVARGAGWSAGAGAVFGLAIAIASTAVLLRVLADRDALKTPIGNLAVGWLVVEDLFTVLALLLLPSFGPGYRPDPAGVAIALTTAALKIGGLAIFTYVVGKSIIPRLLDYVARTRSRELFTLAVLVVALGFAVAATKLFGVSMAIGAFLAGMAVGQTDFGSRAASEALPMRDTFAVLFFVSIGMLLDPTQLHANAGLAAATIAAILIGKPLAAFAVIRLSRYPTAVAAFVAGALAQIGEFSFIVAVLGRSLGILPERAAQALVIAAIATITLNPLLLRAVVAAMRRFA